MPVSELIQNLIHKLEVGAGSRILRAVVPCLAVVLLLVVYDLRAYRNFSTPEAMDAAQLARNISEGKGYTTLFIRPFSLYLVQKRDEARTAAPAAANADSARIKHGPHPDLANAPAYPVVLAGLMKILPFRQTVDLKRPFWSDNGYFSRYQPDFLIALFNELLLLVVVALTFLIARKLFDPGVAWLSAGLVLGCELLWRFSASGLSTILLLVIFLGLAWCLLRMEELAREAAPAEKKLLGLVVAAGALAGLGALTRYEFGWVIIPLTVFVALFGGQRKAVHGLAVLGVFTAFLLPWVLRNFAVSGTPFGTAGFAAAEGTFVFPHSDLERSLHPQLGHAVWLTPYIQKFLANGRGILADDLPKLGGSWAGVLFLAGLLMGFRSVPIRRMRYFLLLCLGTFIVVQALGQTQLSEESPVVNSENLLVLLVPLVFIYGASFFFTFLDQMRFPLLQVRYAVIALFVAACCLPLAFALLLPKGSPVAYPPYFPPHIQQTAGWMKPEELVMSDVPWAVAWYGNRQCVWLTLDAQDNFFALNDYVKPVSALLLTPKTMDGKFFSDWGRSAPGSWGRFIMYVVAHNQPPPGFPLRQSAPNLPTGFFLTDAERWKLAPLQAAAP